MVALQYSMVLTLLPLKAMLMYVIIETMGREVFSKGLHEAVVFFYSRPALSLRRRSLS